MPALGRIIARPLLGKAWSEESDRYNTPGSRAADLKTGKHSQVNVPIWDAVRVSSQFRKYRYVSDIEGPSKRKPGFGTAAGQMEVNMT